MQNLGYKALPDLDYRAFTGLGYRAPSSLGYWALPGPYDISAEGRGARVLYATAAVCFLHKEVCFAHAARKHGDAPVRDPNLRRRTAVLIKQQLLSEY